MPKNMPKEEGIINKMLPQSPAEGPPLPKVLSIKWPKAIRDRLTKMKVGSVYFPFPDHSPFRPDR